MNTLNKAFQCKSFIYLRVEGVRKTVAGQIELFGPLPFWYGK
jgi:hypothetical protein